MATATNPATGERLVLIGDAWKPYTQSATGPQGAKLYLIEGAWVPDTGAAPVASAPAQPAPVALAPEAPAAPEQSWGAAERDRRKAAWDAADIPDLIAGTPVARAVVGVAKPVIGAAQLGADAIDWVAQKYGYTPQLSQTIADHMKTLEGMQRRGQEAYGDGSTDVLGMAGGMVLPTKVAGTVLSKAGVPIIKRAAQSGVFGGGVALSTPSTTPGLENRFDTAAVGTAIGAAIPFVVPTVTAAGKVIYRATIEPWANPAAIKGRAYLSAAGDKASDILNFMRRPQELVPGSMPTAGEAAVGASRPQWSAMQATAKQILPDEYLARADAQKAAQIAQIQTVGKTPKDLQAAEAARTAQADIDYPAAIAAGIVPGSQTVAAPRIQALIERPSMKDIITDAKILAKDAEKGWSGKWDNVQDLDYIKKALDAKIRLASKPTYPKGEVAHQNLLDMKTELLDIMKGLTPAYTKARTNFAEASKPIDQMKIGQFLEGKLTPALGEESAPLRANTFANVVANAPATIKKSLTDAPRYTELKQVLTPQQLAAVESVEQDLARQARDQLMARAGGAAGLDAAKIGTASMQEASGGRGIPNPLSTKVTILNAIIGRLEGAVDKKLAKQIAEEMLNPRTVAAILHRAMYTDARNKSIQNFLAAGRAPMQAAVSQNAMTE